MEIKELEGRERTVLAAALQLTTLADGRAGDQELRSVDRVVNELGEDAYREACDDAEREAGDLETFEAILPTVTRQEARELIYGTVLESAMGDAVSTGEEPVLEKMAHAWNITVQVEPLPEPLPEPAAE